MLLKRIWDTLVNANLKLTHLDDFIIDQHRSASNISRYDYIAAKLEDEK